MNQRLSRTVHFECVSVVLLRYPLKRGPLTGGWAYAPHRTAPEKPKHVLIAFQSDKSSDQDKNSSLFDHLSATQVSVVLNDTNIQLVISLLILRSTDMSSTTKCLPSLHDTIMGWIRNCVDIIAYKDMFPVFYFDVSKQRERVSPSVVDIKIRMRFAENFGSKCAYALVISDRRLKFQSDGKKMNVIY